MTVNWHHHEEARDFAISLRDKRARAALRGVHTLLLESSGTIPLNFLEHRIQPKSALDLRILYTCISHLFSEWSESKREFNQCPNAKLTQVAEAREYVSRQKSEREKIAQSNFIAIIFQTEIQGNESIDLLFCCELLHPILSNNKTLDDILSGSAENSAIQLSQDNDAWDKLWQQDGLSE